MEKFAGNSQDAKNSQDEGRPLQLLHKPESLGRTVHKPHTGCRPAGGAREGPLHVPPICSFFLSELKHLGLKGGRRGW